MLRPWPPLLLLLACLLSGQAWSLTLEEARAIASGESDARIAALNRAVSTADARTVAYLQALSADAVKLAGERVLILREDAAFDAVSGAPAPLPDDAQDVITNNRMRGEIDTALATLQLFSQDAAVRRSAIQALQNAADETRLPLIEKAYAAEALPALKARLGLVRAAALLGSSDKARRLEAARLLADSDQAATKTLLLDHWQSETDPAVKAALLKACAL